MEAKSLNERREQDVPLFVWPNSGLSYFKRELNLNPIRRHPRFAALLKGLKFQT